MRKFKAQSKLFTKLFKRKNRVIKTIAMGLLSVFISINLITPLSAIAVNLSAQLGTNKALGSPLLNDNFNYEQWNKWELLTFGIFLSNFTNPLVDSYKTAFTVNNKGSAGAGKKALEFGSGSDSQGNKALEAMLDYAVKNQATSAGKPIQAVYTVNTNGSVTEEKARGATINDLLCQLEMKIGTGTEVMDLTVDGSDVPYIKDDGITASLSGGEYNVIKVKESRLCKLVVAGDSQGQFETIFDWRNGWDAQMMSAWIAKVRHSDYAGKANDNLKKLSDANSPLFMDAFGNICSALDGENIVIIPAAANSHIYSTPKYNLLNSVILSSAYTDSSGAALNKSLEAYKYSIDKYKAGMPLKTKGVEDGEVLVYFDTDSAIFSTLAKNTSVNPNDINPNWGNQLNRLMNSDINRNTSDSLGIRIAVIGEHKAKGLNEIDTVSEHLARSTDLINTMYPVEPGKETLAHITTEKGDVSLFGSYYYVPVNSWTDSGAGGDNTFTRAFTNNALKYMDGSSPALSGSTLESAYSLKSVLMSKKSFTEVKDWLWYNSGDSSRASKLMTNYLATDGTKHTTLQTKDLSYLQKLISGSENDSWDSINSNVKINSAMDNHLNRGDNERLSSIQRVLKVYTKNETMQAAMNVLGVREGTEFALWTPRIYLTYLKWFGILDNTNDFNKHLFSESSDLLNKNAEELFSGTFLTEEEKKAEIMNYTYLMLHPSSGREYRAEVIRNWFTDYMYDSYQSMVHGNATEYYDGGSLLGTRSNSGFLSIPSYSENSFTAPLIQCYAKYAIIILGFLLVATVIVGVINQKKFSWYIISTIIAVNSVLLTPSMGEITPYVANNMTQKLFGSKMTYWAMAESIANARLEEEVIRDSNGNTADSNLTMNDYIRMLNVVYLDRSVMLKHDISKKITEDSTGIISEIQSLQSTRWLLPTLIRQFSAEDGSANYVYQSLGDVYDNWSNMYWVYDPDDRLSVSTSNASSIEVIDSPPDLKLASKKSRYSGYKDTSIGSIVVDAGDYMTYTTKSTSRIKDDEALPHTGFYLIDGLSVPDANGDWDKYVDNHGVDSTLFINKAQQMEALASSYNPSSVGAKPEFGFLWTTENTGHYFYEVVKDTFDSNTTLATLIGNLQGYYKVSLTTGDSERQSFMHYRDTGYVRDILDLEELFTNVIPYMYSVELIACGEDGTNGVLGDAKMSSYELYKDNYKSWLFRSNWVTKLMEDKDLIRPCTIKTSDGHRYRVENPMLPSSYGEGAGGRKMIFSEAEQQELGLSDAALSPVELKIIKVNKAVEKDWTMLINYANTPDITTEVFYRQMATDAMLEFNKEFSPDRLINGSKALFPTSLDLRSISFDSIMKMLMINSTRDASCIYGDTMKNIIERGDIVSGVILLITTFVCAFVMPFCKVGISAGIFYLGMYTMIRNILADGLNKMKTSTAIFINNVLFLLINLVYYAMIALLINTSTADSVLSEGNVVVNAGPPTWQFLLLLISTAGYLWFSVLLMWFVWTHRNDGGFETYASWGKVMVDKLHNGIGSLKDHFSKNSSDSKSGTGEPVGNSAHNSVESDVSSGSITKVTADDIVIEPEVNVEINGNSGKASVRGESRNEATFDIESESSGFQMDDIEVESADDEANFFDMESERGSQMK